MTTFSFQSVTTPGVILQSQKKSTRGRIRSRKTNTVFLISTPALFPPSCGNPHLSFRECCQYPEPSEPDSWKSRREEPLSRSKSREEHQAPTSSAQPSSPPRPRVQEGGGGKHDGCRLSGIRPARKTPRAITEAFSERREPSSKSLGETAAGGRFKNSCDIYHFTKTLKLRYLPAGKVCSPLVRFLHSGQSIGHVFTVTGFKFQHFLGNLLTLHQISYQELSLLPSQGLLRPSNPFHFHRCQLLRSPSPHRYPATTAERSGRY